MINNKLLNLEELQELNKNIDIEQKIIYKGLFCGSSFRFIDDFSNQPFNVTGTSLFTKGNCIKGIALENANAGEDVIIRI